MELSKSRAGRISLTASESGELSQESTKWGGGHGVFTYFLVEGLKGSADVNADGLVTLGELIQYSSSNVTKETASAQHPDTAGKIDTFFPMALVNNNK
jgi:uncharacterized caspase-like protein